MAKSIFPSDSIMFSYPRLLLFSLSLGFLGWALPSLGLSQDPPATATESQDSAASPPDTDIPPLPDLTIPANADSKFLMKLIATAKGIKPQSAGQFKAMQTAIRDASRQLLKVTQANKVSAEYRQAEMDVIASSVSLMTYFSEKEQSEVVAQVHEFLKGRAELSMQDVQTGMFTAAMLELQPNKKPSRDTYQLMDELLKEDEREEMQSLRINLQAAVRRLDLLGNKFDLKAMALGDKSIDIDDYAGKFVVVDFFATWCEPCLAEIPRLARHYDKYRDKGLEIIGISLDGEAGALQQFLDREKLPWPIIHDNAENISERIQMKFGVSSLPTVLLLNKEGTVVSLEARGAELDRLLQMLFEAPTPAAPNPNAPTSDEPTPATPEAGTPTAENPNN